MESTSSAALKYDTILPSTDQNLDDVDTNSILYIITLKCKEEMENSCLQKPLDDYIERVAHYTGLSKNAITKAISKDLKEIDLKNKYFQLKERITILENIAELYAKNEIPTYKNIFTLYKNSKTDITFSQFLYMMNITGFEYRKTELGKEILIEDPSLTFERYMYIKQINNFRAKCAPIYYIDERFFDSTFSKPQLVNDEIDFSSPVSNGYVFFHAISKQGFLNGLFCSPTTKRDFFKWVSHILIPQLPGPSVIVLDNNNLHGSLMNTVTKYSSKNEMLQYLRQRNVPCNEHLHKAELYELITKCSVKDICYDVDEILKAHGHHVLRLPANYRDLSMTNFLWKYFMDSEPDFLLNIELSQIKIVLLERLSCLPQKLWESFHELLLLTEENILKIDSNTYQALEKNYKISL